MSFDDDLNAEIEHLQAEQEACTKALDDAMKRRGVSRSERAPVGKSNADLATLAAKVAMEALMKELRPVLLGYRERIERLEEKRE